VKCLGDTPERCAEAIIACIRDDGAQKIVPDMFRDILQDVLPLELFKQTICKMKMGVFFGHGPLPCSLISDKYNVTGPACKEILLPPCQD
jgi:hypothetical protein